MAAPGYELIVQPVKVSPGAKADFVPAATGPRPPAAVRSAGFNGPDFSDFGCGPAGAIDNAQGTGWGSTTGDDDGTPTNAMIAQARRHQAAGEGEHQRLQRRPVEHLW